MIFFSKRNIGSMRNWLMVLHRTIGSNTGNITHNFLLGRNLKRADCFIFLTSIYLFLFHNLNLVSHFFGYVSHFAALMRKKVCLLFIFLNFFRKLRVSLVFAFYARRDI